MCDFEEVLTSDDHKFITSVGRRYSLPDKQSEYRKLLQLAALGMAVEMQAAKTFANLPAAQRDALMKRIEKERQAEAERLARQSGYGGFSSPIKVSVSGEISPEVYKQLRGQWDMLTSTGSNTLNDARVYYPPVTTRCSDTGWQ